MKNCRRSVSSRFLAALITLPRRVARSCCSLPSVDFAAPSSVASIAGTDAMIAAIRSSMALVGLLQRAIDRFGQRRREQAVQRRLVARLQRLEGQLVLFEKARARRIEHRRARSRIQQRHRHAEMFVHLSQLREIRQLVRAADVTHGREERVFDDRTKQHVRAERLGPRARVVCQSWRVGGFDRRPRSIDAKQRRASLRRAVDLRVITAGREPLPGLGGERPRSARMRDLVRENLARERLGGAVGAFEDDDAEIAERAVEHAGEGVGHVDAGRVRLSQIVRAARP